jgi:hypothetical protein
MKSGEIYQLRNDTIRCMIISYNIHNATLLILENNRIVLYTEYGFWCFYKKKLC